MRSWLALVVLLTGCQTLQQKSEFLAADRAQKLKHLSSWKPAWCQVDTELTEPAKARYEQMFPFESADGLSYAWKSRESTCELIPLGPSSVAKSHGAFLETALCLLMQVHYVNSPFDELEMKPSLIVPVGEKGQTTHIKAGDKPELGIFLPHDAVTVETRTKSRGVLRAFYGGALGEMLPMRLEQDRGGTVFVVDEIEYEVPENEVSENEVPENEVPATRPMLKSFWIEVGSEKPLRHSKALIRDCRPL